MTPEQLSDALDCPLSRAQQWAAVLTTAMDKYEINTPDRQAAFIAQIGHESGKLIYTRELWGPTPTQERYEGRADLGNNVEGDGFRFRGRGLIQITGRANYAAVSVALMSYASAFLTHPEQLEQSTYASLSAAWFWQTHGCNELADRGDFEAITRRINGGLNGLPDRLALFASAQQALGSDQTA